MTIKLEPGFWRTRDGQKVEIVGNSTLVTDYPWLGVIVKGRISMAGWSNDGSCSKIDQDYDIVAPWSEPKKKRMWETCHSDGRIAFCTQEDLKTIGAQYVWRDVTRELAKILKEEGEK
jgi:hypothetical protein